MEALGTASATGAFDTLSWTGGVGDVGPAETSQRGLSGVAPRLRRGRAICRGRREL